MLDVSHVSVVDVSGLEVMEEQYAKLYTKGKQLVLCGLSRQPLRVLSKSGFLDHIGRANVCRSADEAVYRARELLRQNPTTANGEVSNNVKVIPALSLGKAAARRQQVPGDGANPHGAYLVQGIL